mmetsp:Transcript_24487/g.43447  ORF Transcript_24487/g.43447 Transcript_24487/m.43447 type:complete len:212 (+) Transcript_24487:181-816(+)
MPSRKLLICVHVYDRNVCRVGESYENFAELGSGLGIFGVIRRYFCRESRVRIRDVGLYRLDHVVNTYATHQLSLLHCINWAFFVVAFGASFCSFFFFFFFFFCLSIYAFGALILAWSFFSTSSLFVVNSSSVSWAISLYESLKTRVTFPTPFVVPSRKMIVVPSCTNSGRTMKRNNTEALSPVLKHSPLPLCLMRTIFAVCLMIPQWTTAW